MRGVRHFIVAMFICAALVLATAAAAGGPLLLRATASQSSVGVSGAARMTLCAGFCCAGLPGSSLYLPLVVRS